MTQDSLNDFELSTRQQALATLAREENFPPILEVEINRTRGKGE